LQPFNYSTQMIGVVPDQSNFYSGYVEYMLKVNECLWLYVVILGILYNSMLKLQNLIPISTTT
jgi:hypothetical protein